MGNIPSASADVPGTQIIRRIATLLRLLGARNRQGARLMDLCRDAELERSTVHRILQGLAAEGLVMQDHKSKRYYLGHSVYELGLTAAPTVQLRDIAQPFLLAVAEQTGDTVFISERAGFDGVCLDRKDGGYPIKAFVLEPGRRRPLTVGCGNLSMLSALGDDEVARICMANASRMSEKYPRITPDVLRQRIATTRRQGYAHTDVVETVGVSSVAMCIRDKELRPVAAISVSSVSSRLEGQRVAEAVAFLEHAVREIEARLPQVAGSRFTLR
ncbi:IclR family transcriptional regulator [Paracidovorax cattleyae]|uniref:DNA-binding transcriptional regulator, IclR family n=1 Tax=Paracidovorax cattleyae TaxID=80868 RepID=A0A1H0WAJ4_9BURK|nr:IclR family transcriptional regulator [Paracidovorax cattleyae]SDP87658.1 DNA-binding transcriptional regulator, IclR family [Paracidovorax cattleyae]